MLMVLSWLCLTVWLCVSWPVSYVIARPDLQADLAFTSWSGWWCPYEKASALSCSKQGGAVQRTAASHGLAAWIDSEDGQLGVGATLSRHHARCHIGIP